MDGSTRLDDRVVPLTEVLTTAELGRRSLRPPDFEVENRALVALADELASSPETLLQSLIETAFELCRAESTGISVLEAGEGRGRFRWNAMAGPFASHLGETTSRDGSPCGTVLDRDAALLIERPARHFTELRGTQPEPVEALLVPFTSRTSRSARFGRSGIRTNAGSRRKMRDSSDDGWVSVDVRDTGPGIAPGQRDRIFEAFTQLDGGKTRARGGVGLGLAVCRKLARLLGGDIAVESRVGEGCTFTLRLPRRGSVLSAAAQPPA